MGRIDRACMVFLRNRQNEEVGSGDMLSVFRVLGLNNLSHTL